MAKLPKAKDGKWIQKAVNPKHKGYCTPMTKSTCTPKRKALARTFKKHHGFHKATGGPVGLEETYNSEENQQYRAEQQQLNSHTLPLQQGIDMQSMEGPLQGSPLPTGDFTKVPVNDQALANTKLAKTTRTKNPRNYFGLPYNTAMSAYNFDTAGDRKKELNSMVKPGGMTDDAWKDYTRGAKTGIAGNNMAGAGYALLQGFDTAKTVLGAIGAEKQWRLGKMAERESFNLHNRERAENTGPYNLNGDDSELGGGRQDALAKYGKRLPLAENGDGLLGMIDGPSHEEGGVPMNFTQGGAEVNDLKSSRGNAQIEAQGGETAIKANGSGYIFSKEKDMASKKGDYVNKLAKLPDGGYSLNLFEDKFSRLKDDDMITPAKASTAFSTEDDLKTEAKLVKKLGKSEKVADGIYTYTTTARKTAELNNKLTLKPDIDNVRNEIALKNVAPLEVIAPMNDSKRKTETGNAKYGQKMLFRMKKGGPTIVNGDTIDNYSELRTPYSGLTNLNRTNLKETFKQFGQKGDETDGYYDQVAAQLEKGDRMLNPILSNWNAYGQHKNADGTFGDISDDQLISLENSPGFEFMKAIAAKKGKLHFDPNDQDMIDAYEKAANSADEANGAIPHFTSSNTQPFGKKKFGNWHASYSPWVHQSEGGVNTPASANDPNLPIVYKNKASATTAAPVTAQTDDAVGAVPSVNLTKGKRPRIYHEGLNPWQLSGELTTLLDPYEPAPYIEDQGAKDAFAMGTKPRYTDIQPQLNRITRDLRARTRYNPQDPSANAQYASNAYEAANQVYGQKYNADAQIDNNFNQIQQGLKLKAGANKAQALDTLAQRTAKGHSAYSDRLINAISLTGNKFVHQQAEDRASALYQDMFPNFGYDGFNGTRWQGQGSALSVGGQGAYGSTKSEVTRRMADAKLLQAQYNAHKAANPDLYDDEGTLKVKKNGGKLPKKMVKKLK